MEVKIVTFNVFTKPRAERELEQLINAGWRVVAAGGGGTFQYLFVILQRG